MQTPVSFDWLLQQEFHFEKKLKLNVTINKSTKGSSRFIAWAEKSIWHRD